MATKRVFSYDSRAYDDFDPTQTPEQVKQMMAAFLPELATAKIKEVKSDTEPDTMIYVFERQTGTKGVKTITLILPECPWCKTDEAVEVQPTTSSYIQYHCGNCNTTFERGIKFLASLKAKAP